MWNLISGEAGALNSNEFFNSFVFLEITMTKYHVSADGPAVCHAEVRSCPIGGEHFENYAQANREYEKQLEQTYGGPFVELSKPKTLPTLHEGNVGELNSNFDNINFITNGRDEYISGAKTPYLGNEESIYLKKQDDYFVHVAVLGEDSVPLVSSSFDVFADRDAELEKISFAARYLNGESYGSEAPQLKLDEIEPLYNAFKKHGGSDLDQYHYAVALYRTARNAGDIPNNFFAREEREEENARKKSRHYFGPSKAQRDFAYAVVKELF